MTLLSAVAIALCVLAAGFYAGVEMGFYRLNRIRLALRLRRRDKGAARLDAFIRRPDEFVIMTLVAHNLFVFLATLVCTGLYEPRWHDRAELLATLTLLVPVFIFGEVLPKEVIGRAADLVMYRVTAAIVLSQRLLAPAVWVLVRMQRFWRLFPRYRTAPAEVDVERHRLDYFLSEGAREGTLSAYQHAMAANIMRLRALTVEGVMVAGGAIVALRAGQSLDECRELARSSRFRRYPVADEHGRFIGLVNILDVLAHSEGVFDLRDYLREPVVFRRDEPVIDALHRLRRHRLPMGFVEDAHGDIIGLVTLKDLVEEIVGELGAW